MSQTKRLAYMGLLTALAVVLINYLSVHIPIGGVEGIRIGFGHFPIILAGFLYGPWAGAAVGAAADLIHFVLFPTGPYMPHFTAAYALTGALPALGLALVWPKRQGPPSLVQLSLAITSGQALSSVLLIPFLLNYLFKMPWAVTFPPKLLAQVIAVPCYIVLSDLILRRLNGYALLEGRPEPVRGTSGMKA